MEQKKQKLAFIGQKQQQQQKPQTAPPLQQQSLQQCQVAPQQFPQQYQVPQQFLQRSPSSSQVASRVTHAETEKDKDKELVSVIVTIYSSSSYDDLFRSVPQIVADGRVSVFQMQPEGLPLLANRLNKQSTSEEGSSNAIIDEIASEIESLSDEPESVVFNWECCGSWSSKTFGSYKENTMNLIKLALDRKHMVMFSDFALKALIQDWSEPHLGPNPFVNIGEFSDSFELRFDPHTLKDCESAQLQKVGELCENGQATIHALGGTIAFTVKKDVSTTLYELEVMTVATRLGHLDLAKTLTEETTCTIGNYTGAAGHVMLHFASGGKLLVSCGHWIEIARLDVSVESLIKVATKSYGENVSVQIQSELSATRSAVEREEVVQKYARQFVQQSAPCKYKKSSGF